MLYGSSLNILFLLAALGVGAPVTARIGMKRESTGPFILFAISVGFGVLSLITFLCGALRL